MTSSLLHPGIILILFGLFIPLIKNRLIVLLFPIVSFIILFSLDNGTVIKLDYGNYELILLSIDKLSRLFSYIFLLILFATAIFSINQDNKSEISSAFVYVGSSISVVLSGDLITLFIFWEIMAITSTIVIWSGSKQSYYPGIRYLAVHLLGGSILLIGIIGYANTTGTLTFGLMSPDNIFSYFVLAGFLINAGAPPFSSWIPDAYPSASWSGTVFLSAFTTKTAVYVLIVGYAGYQFLIYVGIFMIFYGIIFAILENDMRRILSYSIVNQVGFMIVAVGIGTEIAINGASSHAFTHIIYKALLLMSAGSVFYITGRTKCTDLGGLYKTMPLTMICGIIGALSISAFPLTSGFISKSLTVQATVYEDLKILWLLLTMASAGVFLHAGIKFPWFVFFQKDAKIKAEDPPKNMRLAMILLSALCILIGVFPSALYSILPYDVKYVPYTLDHVSSQLQLLMFSGLAFFILLKYLKRTLTITLDFDWFWRKFGVLVVNLFDIYLLKKAQTLIQSIDNLGTQTIRSLHKYNGPSGMLGRSWSTGSMALWTAILLGLFLLFYLFA